MSYTHSTDYSAKQLQADIYTQFAGFPRRKATDFEREITSADAVRQESALRYLREASAYYRAEQLDPPSVLERTPKERTP